MFTTKKNFQQRLSEAKSIFSKALADAEQINFEIQEGINERVAQVKALEQEIIELENTQEESVEFITNDSLHYLVNHLTM